MRIDKQATREDRMRIANQIVGLSGGILSTAENPNYIALKLGTRNAVTVRKNLDRVSFYLRSTLLLDKARAAGFNPVEAQQRTQRDRGWYQFPGLSLNDILSHDSLFREIVGDSVCEVADRKRTA